MKDQLNRILQAAGLSTTGDPAALCAQIGYLVRDHEHFLSLLVACTPENRSTMYESLRPHLRFVPKPLDVYMAEAAMDAAARQLPVQNPDGTLGEYKVPEITSQWRCSWCGEPSHEPAKDEVIVCPKCGTEGVTDRQTAREVFKVPTLESKTEDEAVAQNAVAEALAQQHLWLICRKCTKEATFDGPDRGDCVKQARNAGWAYDSWAEGSELCPECLK